MRRNGAKNKYTCLNKDCKLHSWICTAHKDENRPLYEAHQRDFLEKNQRIVFSHLCTMDPGHNPLYMRNSTTNFSSMTNPEEHRQGPPTRQDVDWVTLGAVGARATPQAVNPDGQDLDNAPLPTAAQATEDQVPPEGLEIP